MDCHAIKSKFVSRYDSPYRRALRVIYSIGSSLKTSGLTQVLTDGENTYLYGLSRLGQEATDKEYFLGDAPRSCEASGASPAPIPIRG